jgi:hypothetical protein
MKGTYTITFGDQAENHVGMQKLGQLANEGFTLDDLKNAQSYFQTRNVPSTIYDLKLLLPSELQSSADDAYLLHVPHAFYNSHELFQEQTYLNYDTKAFMYGRVVNKRARYNLCFAHTGQEPNYSEGKGSIVSFSDVPLLKTVHDSLPDIIGEKANDLLAEGNFYYDPTKCGIGFHGDAERKKVIALRLGESLPLQYQWFHQCKSIGTRGGLTLNHGDLYIMSEKAVGTDWKKRSQITLRHAAGAKKYLK